MESWHSEQFKDIAKAVCSFRKSGSGLGRRICNCKQGKKPGSTSQYQSNSLEFFGCVGKATMWFLASIIRLHLLLVIGSALWVVAKADNRILLEPEYILHQRPPTQEGEPLSSRSDPSNLHDCVQRTTKHEAIHVQHLGEHQPAQCPGSEGEGICWSFLKLRLYWKMTLPITKT